MTPFKLPDRYRPTKEHYEGGQGDVWVYEDTDLERKVAVKFMKPSADANQLLDEIASLRAISSKHVAQIYDLQFHKRTGNPALIQEYIPGPDLSELAKAGLTGDEALLTLYQIASGLADVHAANKVHRDVKPFNMKRDAEGIIKLLDFGLTCDALPEHATNAARGTDGFRAPEMYLPNTIITPAIDSYAFAVTAWMLLARGQLPSELLSVPPQLPAPSFASLGTGLAPDVVSMLDKCLSEFGAARPRMAEVSLTMRNRLLYGKHRALISQHSSDSRTVLTGAGKAVKLTHGDLSVQIGYDGLIFRVQQVSGSVYINNTPCRIGSVVPESCLITLGANRARAFFLFDMSHPEVVL